MKKGYGTGIAFSLSMHGLLIATMLVTFDSPQTPRTVVPPTYVNATLLVVEGVPQMEARTEPAPRPAPTPPPPPPPPPPQEDRQAEQRRQEEAARAEEQRRTEEQRRATEARRKAEEEEARRAEAERRRQEEEARRRAEAERQRQEEERRRQEDERLRAEAAAEAERQRREEEQFMQAAVARQAVNTYEGLVQQRIADNWRRPPGARRDMEVELAIRMMPNGQIVDVAVVKSSGSEAFDQSAVQAVRRVDRIPEFQDLDPTVFNANFRRFNLRFRPEDLRL